MVANPMTVLLDAPPQEFDFLVTSIDENGSPGNLNRDALEAAGYTMSDLPPAERLRSGFYRLQEGDRKPLLFVVTKGAGAPPEMLRHNLYNGLLTCERDIVGKTVWLPLLGTGAGDMDFWESYSITAQVLQQLDFSGNGTPPVFVLAVPGSENGRELMRRLESGETQEDSEEEEGSPSENSVRPKGRKTTKRAERPAASPSRSGNASWLALFYGPHWETDGWDAGQTVIYRPRDQDGNTLYNTAPLDPGPGDHILGYVHGDRQQVFAEFRVKSAAGTGIREELILELVLTEKFSPVIPLHTFRVDVPGLETFLGPSAPAEGLLRLTDELYETIRDKRVPPFRNNYIPFYLTEGNHRETEDKLDFKADIESFANVICLESVSPPLAIGLFGNWGSGKSFFMEKLEARIEELCRSGREDFVKDVVPVRFNSWHYSDSNLWASMILQIFDSLNAYANKGGGADAVHAIYAQLESTRAQIAETQTQLTAKTEEVKALETKRAVVAGQLQEKERTLALWSAKDVVSAVLEDPMIRRDFQALNTEFRSRKLVYNAEELEERLEDVKTVGGRIRDAWKNTLAHTGGKWLWVWIAVLVAAILCFCAAVLFRDRVQQGINLLTGAGTALLAGLAGITAKLRPALKQAEAYYERIRSVIKTVRSRKVAAEIEQENRKRLLEADIEALRRQQADLERTKQEGQVKLAQLLSELDAIRSGRKLADFVASKSSDNAYVAQLGIVSRIRKDFEQLNTIFLQQKEARKRAVEAGEANPASGLQIDRIVLYIDDLDRCNEDVVVRVLEAIHLLLAFPLFVVVVGVDPRWLNNALTEKYKLLFGSGGKEGGPMPEGVATSYDYLEKIFQIPFALKPINKTGREDLLAYLVKDELESGGQQKAVGKPAGTGQRGMRPQEMRPALARPVRLARPGGGAFRP